jgi:hypothetical protein
MSIIRAKRTSSLAAPILPAFSRTGIPSAEALQRSRILLAARMSSRDDTKDRVRRAVLSKVARIVADLAVVGLVPCIGLAGLHMALHPLDDTVTAGWELGALATGFVAALAVRMILTRRAKSNGEPKTIAEFVGHVRLLAQGSPRPAGSRTTAALADLQEVDFTCAELKRLRESEYVESYLKRIADAGRKPVRAEVRVAEALYEQERHEGITAIGTHAAAS